MSSNKRVTVARIVRDGVVNAMEADGLVPNWQAIESVEQLYELLDSALLERMSAWLGFHDNEPLLDILSLVFAIAERRLGLGTHQLLNMMSNRNMGLGRYSNIFLGTVTVGPAEPAGGAE